MAGHAHAEVKTNALCSEGMVLEQKATTKIWGTADKGEVVSVSFRGKTAKATADDTGNWSVALETGAAGGPFEMLIQGTSAITFKNVLVGEVWVCSGQSNMEWPVRMCDKTDKDYTSSAPPNPWLRTFNVKKNPQATPQTETGGTWIEAGPKTVDAFSATAYFFGRHLQEKLQVPVGLIHTSWGGTRIEAWMKSAALEALDVKEANPQKIDANTASALYNGMIHPLLSYRVRGAIWYQGESNAGRAYQYRTLHPALIENWRADWHNPDLAFYFVQLAPYTPVNKEPGESNWAELREAQTMTLKLKNTGQAVITDFGNEYDIHPTPKRPVGERLALAARALTYGEKIVYSGPMYKSVRFDGSRAILTFDHVGGGLTTKELVPTLERVGKPGAAWRVKEGSKGSALIGFTVCGEDKVFRPAKAEIVGNTVVVTSDQVQAPVAVRYGWANHPLANLFNQEGLPASPFRTDRFPGVTQPKQ
jgi:sialate O-acetylesterase